MYVQRAKTARTVRSAVEGEKKYSRHFKTEAAT